LQYSKLFPKKQFGGRVLLPFELYISLRRIYFGADALRKPDELQPKPGNGLDGSSNIHASTSSSNGLQLQQEKSQNKQMQEE